MTGIFHPKAVFFLAFLACRPLRTVTISGNPNPALHHCSPSLPRRHRFSGASFCRVREAAIASGRSSRVRGGRSTAPYCLSRLAPETTFQVLSSVVAANQLHFPYGFLLPLRAARQPLFGAGELSSLCVIPSRTQLRPRFVLFAHSGSWLSAAQVHPLSCIGDSSMWRCNATPPTSC